MSSFLVNRTHLTYMVEAAVSSPIGDSGRFVWRSPNPDSEKGYDSWELFSYDPRGKAEMVKELERFNAWAARWTIIDQDFFGAEYRVIITRLLTAGLLSRANDFDMVQVLKAVRCFEYQTCDPLGWDPHGNLPAEHRRAYWFIQALKDLAIMNLERYREVDWEVQI